MNAEPDADCFFRDIEPQPPLKLAFECDYLLHAVKGALDVIIDDRRWLLPPSFTAWVPATIPLEVVIRRPVISCSILSATGYCTLFPNHPVVFQMSTLAREMVQHCRHWGSDKPHPAEADVFFRALLNTCAGLIGTSIEVARPSSDDPRLMKAIAYTEDHLDEGLEAATVANAASLSERSMQRKFADEIGETWSQTLTRIRMIKTVELLGEKDLPIIQIATACGFASLSAFNRAFKNFAGATPTRFRKQLLIGS
ncbi:MAG: AraC family transcriptional regulator [Pseudomonadota bacterium]